MNGLSDFYQRLMGIKNLVTNKEHIPIAESAINGMLKFLDQVDIQIGTGKVKLKRAGQAEYLKSLKSRIKHLNEKTIFIYDGYLKKYVDAGREFLPEDDLTINAFRDFYHYLYYSTFYIGRYVLIFNGDTDESQHAKLRGRYNNFSPFDNKIQNISSKVIANIDSLSSKRDVADYIINLDRVREFLTVQTVKDDLENYQSLFDDCEAL